MSAKQSDPRISLRCIARPTRTYDAKCDCWKCAMQTAITADKARGNNE